MAVVGLEGAQILELELLGGVRHPALAEAFPGQHVDAALTEHGPHGHLEGTGVGGWDDGAQVARREAQERPGLVDGELETRLALLGAVRPAEERVVEFLEGPAGALGAGAGGKMRVCRPLGRFRGGGHLPTLPDRCSSAGRSVPLRLIFRRVSEVKKISICASVTKTEHAERCKIVPRTSDCCDTSLAQPVLHLFFLPFIPGPIPRSLWQQDQSLHRLRRHQRDHRMGQMVLQM